MKEPTTSQPSPDELPGVGKTDDTKGMGDAERRAAIDALKSKAQKRGIRRGPGRPVGAGRRAGADGGAGDSGGAGESDAGARASGHDAALGAARDLYAAALDAVRGYREVGYAATGHEHWKNIKPERMEAGARTLVDVLAKLPQGAQVSILSSLVYFRLVAVGYDVFVDPIVKSYNLKTEPKESETVENGANQPA